MRLSRLSKNEVRYCPPTLVAALIISACTMPSQPSSPRLMIRAVEDTVVLRQSIEATAFTITMIVRNDDARVAQVALCGMEAQRNINGVWTTVFTPWCSSSATRTLAPGDSVSVRVDVIGYTLLNRLPALDPRMTAGRYRLLFGVDLDDQATERALSMTRVQASTEFVVK
jgi:hypothetical protein